MRADYLTPREGEKTWHDHVDADDDVVDFFSSALYWLWHSLFIIIIIVVVQVVSALVVVVDGAGVTKLYLLECVW